MKITNDHYNHKTTGVWTHREREVYITDASGVTWRIERLDGGGLKIVALGSGVADDQIQVHPLVRNTIKITAVQP